MRSWLILFAGAVLIAGRDDCGGDELYPAFHDDVVCCESADGGEGEREERIETERHDFTQSTTTVGRGVVQIEAGYSYFYKRIGDEIEQSHEAPETLLRIGLTEDIEFRALWNYVWRFSDDDDDVDAAEDLLLSFKVQATEQACWLPESALEIRFTAPTGGEAWSTESIEAGFDYIYGWELTDRYSLYGSTGFGTNGLGRSGLVPEDPTADDFLVWSQSAAVGIELDESITAYVEWFGIFSRGREEDFALSVFNVGVDYYVTDDFVLDVRAGVGLNDDTDDFFSGVGGGYRF